MVKTFNIVLFDGHLIFEDNGLKVLIDTGSPTTISRTGSFDFMGHKFSCMTNLGGNGISELSEMMGYDIDVLMGMNLIEQFYIQTDYKRKEIVFSSEKLPFESIGTTPIIRGNMGEVVICLSVKGQEVKLLLDTGAKISYIDEQFTIGETIVDTKDDFNPLTGDFKTPIYSMVASVGGQPFPVSFGTLPYGLAMALRRMGLAGAIGYDLFNAFTVLLDFKNNRLSLKSN